MTVTDTTPFANSIFEQPWWMDAVAHGCWKEILVEENGRVLARWPLLFRPREITTPLLTQTSGFWMADDIAANDPYFTARKKVTNLLIDQLPGRVKVDLNLDSGVTYFLPFVWRGFRVEPKVSYRFFDVSDPEALYRGFNQKTKQCIRTARDKVTVTTSDDIEPMLHLLSKTFSRQNLKNPWPPEFVRRLYHACRKHQAVHLIYAQDREGNFHSGNFYVYDEKVCFALLSGSDPAWVRSGARTLLAWEGIRFASTVSRSFDFEGSMVEGIEHYFRQFGATPVVYYHVIRETASERARREVSGWLAGVARKCLQKSGVI
jgi:hypothetical protein